MKMKNFWRTKSWRNFLEVLKWKFDIFIGTKNIFNPIYKDDKKIYNKIRMELVFVDGPNL